MAEQAMNEDDPNDARSQTGPAMVMNGTFDKRKRTMQQSASLQAGRKALSGHAELPC